MPVVPVAATSPCDTHWVPGMLSALHGPVSDPPAGFQKKSRTAPRETPLLARSDPTNEGIRPKIRLMAKKIILGPFAGFFGHLIILEQFQTKVGKSIFDLCDPCDPHWVVPGRMMSSASHDGPVSDPPAGFQKKSRTAPRAETPLPARSGPTNEGIRPKIRF